MSKKASRLAWFPMYGEDFLGGCQMFTQAEVGAYVLALIAQWSSRGEKAIPDDPENLKAICRGPMSARVRAKFETIEGTEAKGLRNQRLASEWDTAVRTHDHARSAARSRYKQPAEQPPGQPSEQPVEQPNEQHHNSQLTTHNSHETTHSAQAMRARGQPSGSRFSIEECERYASGQTGIKNYVGYATTVFRTGEADDRIAEWLDSQRSRSVVTDPGPDGVIARAALLEGRPVEEVAEEFREAELELRSNGNRQIGGGEN